MQIFTVTFLLCVSTALVYGNVDVLTMEHSTADNSVLDGESHSHSTLAPSGIPVTEVPTTGTPSTYSTTDEILTTGKVPIYGQTPYGPYPHPPRMPHECSTTHRNTLFSGIAPYHSFGVHPLWYNRHNGFGMQRPFMISPYSALHSHPMPPLVIVKLLQPIVLPVTRNTHEDKSPKAEIDIDMERIIQNGYHSGHNRFGRKEGHHQFVQNFNHLNQGCNRFGQSFNRLGQFDNMEQGSLTMYGNGFNQFGHGMNHMGMNKFGNGFNQFGHGMNHMGMNRFGNGFNQFGHGMSHMGMNRFGNGFNQFRPDMSHMGMSRFGNEFNQFGYGMSHMGMNRFGNGFNWFNQEPNRYRQGFARLEKNGFRPGRFGKHASPMDEDQDMHITVKLN